MEAFRQALDDGATALELDLHRTADGRFVVAHDPDGRRMAGDPGRIGDHTFDEVRRWNMGARFRGETAGVHVMPTLDEVIDELPEVPISVDFKPADPQAIPDLLELITAKGAERRITITGGVASYLIDGNTENEIIRKADQALYRGKKTGETASV